MEKSQFLQIMRFVAAGLVLCTHATFYYHERVSRELAIWHFGEVGVPIFFVISGVVMVISAQALTANAAGARTFLLRRFIRIVPLWWLALLIKIVIGLALPQLVNHNHVQWDHALKSFFFIPYFDEAGSVVPLHGVGWTLLHEVYFYLLFSAALLLGRQPAFWVSVVILCIWVAGKYVHIDSPFWAVATSTANLQFVIGMIAGHALLATVRKPALRKPLTGLAALLALGLALLPPAVGVHSSYPVLLAVVAATLFLARGEWQTAIPLAKLGDSSYSLYIFHPFIAPAAVMALARLLPDAGAGWNLLITVVVTITACHALHLLVEAPLVARARQLLMPRGLRPNGPTGTS